MISLLLLLSSSTIAGAAPAKFAPRTWIVEQGSVLPQKKTIRKWEINERSAELQLSDKGTRPRRIPIEPAQTQWFRDRISALSIPRKGEKVASPLGISCPNRITLKSDLGIRTLCFEQDFKDKNLAELIRALREASPPEIMQ